MTTNIVSFVVVLGVLIFVHELGHFLIARLFRVGVEKFSLGFGPKLIGRTVGMTEYRISAFPLGGYVKMVGEDPDSEIDPDQEAISFTHKPVWQRMLIVAAGPAFNILLAMVIYFGLFQVNGVVAPVIGQTVNGSAADLAGLKAGDLVLAIDGEKIVSWDQMTRLVREKGDATQSFDIERQGRVQNITVTPKQEGLIDEFGDDFQAYDLGAIPLLKPVIGMVVKDSPAMRAGIKVGDEILEVGGRTVIRWSQFVELVEGARGTTMELVVRRDGKLLTPLAVTPELTSVPGRDGEPKQRYMVGVQVADSFNRVALGPLEAVGASVARTIRVVRLIGVSVARIIRGSVSRKEIGGPIKIAQMAGQQARVGAGPLLLFVAFISINLAILNILPIPVLDGGHLLFFLIEALRGKPLSIRVREIAQQGGMIVLLMLMIFVFYNDITNIFFNLPH